MLVFLFFLRINLTINVAHPVFLMHTQSLLSGYAPGQVTEFILLSAPRYTSSQQKHDKTGRNRREQISLEAEDS